MLFIPTFKLTGTGASSYRLLQMLDGIFMSCIIRYYNTIHHARNTVVTLL